jgi:type VI secretion system secreted protein VgrG
VFVAWPGNDPMSALKQDARPLRVTLGDLPSEAALITRFAGTEAVSRLFTFTLDLATPADAPLDFAAVLGKPAAVQIDQGDLGHQTRTVRGVVSRLAQGRRDGRFVHYRAELVPALWLLTLQTRSRVFQQKTVKEILIEVIGDLYPPDLSRLEATYHPRNYCVQYRETDFAFISRLMEEEGIYYYFTHGDKPGLVLADAPRGHAPVPHDPKLLFQDEGMEAPLEGRVTTWDKAQRLRTGRFALTDHSFELPTNQLDAAAKLPESVKAGTVEHKLAAPGAAVDHPGGYVRWTDGIAPGGADRAGDLKHLFEDNARVARVRAAAEAAGAVEVRGAGTYCRMTAGHRFTLAGHFDANGEYLLTAVTHEAECGAATTGDGPVFRYSNRFEGLPAALPFRPALETPRPVIRGTQTGRVVGTKGEEIEPDKYGRVKVWFRWDPAGERHLDTSCWVRVVQAWAGKRWGAQFLPRVGDEMVVAFEDGDPDRPLVIGSVYNADNLPVYPLPKNKTRSGIKTHSSKGGDAECFNEIAFEDKRGEELLSFHAQKDMAEVVENNFTRSVGGGLTGDPKKVGKSTTTVYGDHGLTVEKGDLSVAVQAGKAGVTVQKEIDVKSNTSFVHVDSPTEIRLTVKGSRVTITPDTITLHAEHIKFEGTTDIKGLTPDLDLEGSTAVKVHGAKVTVDGSDEASFQSSAGKAGYTAKATATLGVDTQTVVCDPGQLAVSGKAIKAKADGTHEIVGTLVKIN